MAELIKITDMCKIYNPGENEVRALDHVSITIDQGEFVAIVGQSGSGKSTLMNMLGCLDVPTSGTYELLGEDVSSLDDDDLSDIRNLEIGFIFQGFNLIAGLTALENVELPLIYRGVSAAKRKKLSKEALEIVGLGKRMTHKPSEMSGGQQQRVAIARAIAQAPPIILADEPTGNLDSKSSREIMNILHKLHEEGRTVILITHDDSIAAEAARVIRIKDGQVESDSGKAITRPMFRGSDEKDEALLNQQNKDDNIKPLDASENNREKAKTESERIDNTESLNEDNEQSDAAVIEADVSAEAGSIWDEVNNTEENKENED